MGKFEKIIIRDNNAFIGRTDWDLSHIKAINLNSHYYYCNEVLRPEFYAYDPQSRNPKKNTIFLFTTRNALKGAHDAIKATRILLDSFPDVELRIAGPMPSNNLKATGYPKWLKSLIRDLNLEHAVTWLGNLNSEQIINELRRAAVVAIPSYIENSCNALQEALLCQTPCVVSMSGGMTSIVRHNETALMYPIGEYEMMAHYIKQLFEDDDLCNKLATKARSEALIRNNPETIAQNTMDIYRQVIKEWNLNRKS